MNIFFTDENPVTAAQNHSDESSIKCGLCQKVFNNINGLAKHLYRSHKDYSKEKYYIEFLGLQLFCSCGNHSKFRGLSSGFNKFCSNVCFNKDPICRKYRSERLIGKKQSQETIAKRIKNTDQTRKKKTLVETFINKYGVENISQLDSIKKLISIGNKGKSSPRGIGHQDNIIKSRILNDTLKHTTATKIKISKSLLALHASDNPPLIVSSGNNNHEKGISNGMFYRSSYERKFIEHCFSKNISVETASTKEFRVRYSLEGKQHFYYPDFYLPDYDLVVEIKPLSMLDLEANQHKFNGGTTRYAYTVVTEEELYSLDEFFKELNESILP